MPVQSRLQGIALLLATLAAFSILAPMDNGTVVVRDKADINSRHINSSNNDNPAPMKKILLYTKLFHRADWFFGLGQSPFTEVDKNKE